ncbi:DUF4838 domain-containing protein [Paenibacillus chungangensis]|uniref:DUF4838 domain-containing protein n=1 Tax=Paenibacillus chungangensis TaxID=696535 RepID=A0ABW3HKP9_9BACL
MKLTIYVDKGTFPSIEEAASAEQEINWWDDGDARAVYCTECFAAMELRLHLQLVWGEESDIRLAPMDGSMHSGSGIFLGSGGSSVFAKLLMEQGLPSIREEIAADRSDEAFRIDTFYREGERCWALCGSGRTGTLYAAYAFLDTLGFQWYAPGKLGTVFPEALHQLPELYMQESPHFRTRGCYSEFIDDRHMDLLDWLGRNRMNYVHLYKVANPHAWKKRGIAIGGGGHDILYRFMNPLHYFDNHPDWFALVNGERQCRRSPDAEKEQFFAGDNHCFSHPEATEELAHNIVRALAEGDLRYVDVLNFWPLDNGNWCGCEACTDSGNLTSRLIGLVHQLRQKIVEAIKAGGLKRNVRILFPAYHETLPAPDRPLPDGFDYDNCVAIFFPIERCYVHTIDDEGCTETNLPVLQHYRNWTEGEQRHYKGELFIGEYYGVRSFAAMPIVLRRIIAHDIPFYYKTGTRHFYYMHMTSGRWGMLALNNYLHAALLWDAAADSEKLTEAYFQCYYKEVSPIMKAFYALLERTLSNIKYMKHYQKSYGSPEKHGLWLKMKEEAGELFPLEHMQYHGATDTTNAGISLVDTVKGMEECRAILDEAIMSAESPNVIERLIEDDIRFHYGQTMVRFYYHMTRTTLLLRDRKELLARWEFRYCHSYAQELQHTRLPLQNYDYSPYYASGLNATWMRGHYEYLYEQLNEQG